MTWEPRDGVSALQLRQMPTGEVVELAYIPRAEGDMVYSVTPALPPGVVAEILKNERNSSEILSEAHIFWQSVVPEIPLAEVEARGVKRL